MWFIGQYFVQVLGLHFSFIAINSAHEISYRRIVYFDDFSSCRAHHTVKFKSEIIGRSHNECNCGSTIVKLVCSLTNAQAMPDGN